MAFLRFLAIKYFILINFERKMVENSEFLVFLGDLKKMYYFFKIFVKYSPFLCRFLQVKLRQIPIKKCR